MKNNGVVGDRTKNHLQAFLLEPAFAHLLTAHIDQQGKVLGGEAQRGLCLTVSTAVPGTLKSSRR